MTYNEEHCDKCFYKYYLICSYLILLKKLLNKLCNLHITEEMTEIQRIKCCSRKHSYKLIESELRFKHRLANTKSSSEVEVQICLMVNRSTV